MVKDFYLFIVLSFHLTFAIKIPTASADYLHFSNKIRITRIKHFISVDFCINNFQMNKLPF